MELGDDRNRSGSQRRNRVALVSHDVPIAFMAVFESKFSRFLFSAVFWFLDFLMGVHIL